MHCKSFPGVESITVKKQRLKYKVVVSYDPIFEDAHVTLETAARFSHHGDACIYASHLKKSPRVTYINIEY